MLKTTVLKPSFRHTVFQIGQILSHVFMKLGSEIRVDIFFYESDDLKPKMVGANCWSCNKLTVQEMTKIQ